MINNTTFIRFLQLRLARRVAFRSLAIMPRFPNSGDARYNSFVRCDFREAKFRRS